jgi:hypothetical protein
MNPFSGSNTVAIKYRPKTSVSNGTIWKLVVYGPGASGWEDTGVVAVDQSTHPPVPGMVPMDALVTISQASPVDADALLMRSALSVAQSNAALNKAVFDVYCDKFVAHALTGNGNPPVHPGPYYGLSDFNTIYNQYSSKGIPVPVPPPYPSR